MFNKLPTPISGLHVYRQFLEPKYADALQSKAVGLCQAILNQSSSAPSHRCQTFLSKYHNLKSDEYLRPIKIDDEPNGKIRGQYFERYGEDGHTLTYFIGNRNIPRFLPNTLITRVLHLPEVMEITQNRLTEWNLTFNTYATSKKCDSTLPGFDFHKDIESNGEVTLIYSIGSPAEFQIRHPETVEKICRIPLLHNTMVLLSNEARWDYEHKVVPNKISDDFSLLETEIESVRRMSLVLGFKKR